MRGREQRERAKRGKEDRHGKGDRAQERRKTWLETIGNIRGYHRHQGKYHLVVDIG